MENTMRSTKTFIILLLLLLTALAEAGAGLEEKAIADLPQHHKDWLEKDVAYIITPREKAAFLQFETDRERDIFIDAFWKQRDPTPGTPTNEFKEEHYRRLAYADKYFGRGTTRPGWQTDRGRVYIILGPPLDIGRYEVESYVHSARIWSYEGKPEYGFPSLFNVIFFRRQGMGDFVLYSPAQDGPAGLLVNYQGDRANITTAYEQLRKFDPRLAEASLSLIPGEMPSYGHFSLASEILLGRINEVPEKMVDSAYAEALLKFKDIVEVDYSANYIGSESMAQVIQDEQGIFFVHYSIRPKQISVLTYEENYSINFNVNGMVSDTEGNVIFQYEKTFPADFSREQIEDVRQTSIVIQDMIPLVAGDYKFSLLLKNTVSKEFASFEKQVSIPQKPSHPSMTPIMLGYQMKRSTSPDGTVKPFQIDNLQISCQAGNTFHPKEDLVVFFQVLGLTGELEKNGSIRFTIYKKEEEFVSTEKTIAEFALGTNIMETFPLRTFPPDYYKIEVSILDGAKNIVVSANKNFEITHAADLPRPWIIAKVMPSSQNVAYSYILGSQFAQKGDLAAAEVLLKKAHDEVPSSLDYALSYSQLLFNRKEYREARNILMPFSTNPAESSRALSLLGACSQALGEYEEAISFYKTYLSHAGTNLNILNSVGECYLRLGNNKEALVAWERSLEIDPGQENLKKIVADLKKNKNKDQVF
jgi:GWxTD domain-containing protein